eukprot:TRINITY_DN72812_c0_g1_i1.p1 TRINITY_DN72812_c0_g1~~TRINITY_DN72812_c0_g1_i1.p1  ORF type:complete len:713 (-),score=223.07 TRINITY_DN72812_c0_g1_i1:292-2430(-)
MQLPVPICTCVALLLCVQATKLKDAATPVGKVIELLEGLEAKVAKDGVREEETHIKFQSWCEETNNTKRREMQTETARKEKFAAIVSKADSKVQAAAEKLASLSSEIAKAQDDMSTAQAQREKDAADFQSNEKEMMEAHDTASRAISVLKAEAEKQPALLQQLRAPASGTGADLVESLAAVAEAASISSHDSRQLQGLLLMQRSPTEAAAYTPQSAGIVDLLEDMIDKTRSDLTELRTAEKQSKHDFALLRQSLNDQLSVNMRDQEVQRSTKLEAEERRSSAQGEVEEASKEIEEVSRYVQEITQDCQQSATEFDISKKARKEELQVMKKAKDILRNSMPSSRLQTDDSYAFFQVATYSSGQRTDAIDVVQMLRKLARQEKSSVLAQLASRAETTLMHAQRTSEDPFAKITQMIAEMISSREAQVNRDLKKEEFCQIEKKKATEKHEEKEAAATKVNSRLEQVTAAEASVQGEMQQLQADISTTQEEQMNLTEIRKQQHEDYTDAKADLQQSLQGVRKASSVLRDYYESTGSSPPEAALVQETESGSSAMEALMQQPEPPPKPTSFAKKGLQAGGILQILEQAESDFATSLSEEETKESEAATEYEKATKDAKESIMLKTNDVKHKTLEAAELKKRILELSSDSNMAGEELSAVKEYLEQLKEQCTVKGETYEEKKAKRDTEISNLKEALKLLGGNDLSLLQKRSQTFLGRR